jgi:hypothetical protein
VPADASDRGAVDTFQVDGRATEHTIETCDRCQRPFPRALEGGEGETVCEECRADRWREDRATRSA